MLALARERLEEEAERQLPRGLAAARELEQQPRERVPEEVPAVVLEFGPVPVEGRQPLLAAVPQPELPPAVGCLLAQTWHRR
jgi:hypothetical protein